LNSSWSKVFESINFLKFMLTFEYWRNIITANGEEVVLLDTEKLKLISVKDAAKRLDVSDQTIRTLITKGELKAIRVGGQFKIPVDNLGFYVERQIVAPKVPTEMVLGKCFYCGKVKEVYARSAAKGWFVCRECNAERRRDRDYQDFDKLLGKRGGRHDKDGAGLKQVTHGDG